MELSDRQVRLTSGGVVSALGLVLLSIPIYDVWDDVVNIGWAVSQTFVENVLPVGLAAILIYGGVRLTTLDWDGEHTLTVAKWTAVGAIGSTVLFVWIVWIQLWAAGLKPFIIALNGILLGSVVSFGVGTYAASRQRTHQALQRQHERMSALFANTSDYIATARVTPEELRVREINDALADSAIEPVPMLERVLEAVDDVDGLEGVLWHAHSDEIVETRYERDGQELLVRIVPFEVTDDSAEVFFVLTDISEQTELAREMAARERAEYLHTIASEIAGVEAADDAYELTAEAVDHTVDPDAVAIQVDGVVVHTRGTDGLLDSDAVEQLIDPSSGGIDSGQAIRTRPEGETVTVRIGDHGVLQVAAADLADEDVTVLELIATHLREALTRIDRRQDLAEERERLAFVNRIVRHDLLDSVNVLHTQLELLKQHVSEDGTDRLGVLRDRVDQMADELETMRSFMQAVESGQDRQQHPVALSETVREEVAEVRDAAPAVEIAVDVPDVEVLADELLGDVFQNLLHNAYKHNDAEQPRIEIDGDVHEETVEIRVADNGPGIAEDRQDDVFQRGERGAASPGTGIGLYLVEQLVHGYDGSIDVAESDMGGAEFRLTLPLADD
jgi:signal transduction histidine kinase